MIFLLALLLSAQDSKYENADYGIRVRIPPGWNIDGARQPRVILKITPGGDYVVRPEILLYEIPFAEPITLPQYKEQLRHYIQRAFKEPRMIDDRQGEAGGRAGFSLEVVSKGAADADVTSLKGVFQRSPRRMIGVDGVFPAGKEAELRKVYDGLIASLEFTPKRKPEGLESGAKDVAEALKNRPGPPAPGAEIQELGIFVGEKQMGSYRVELRAAKQGTSSGDEFRTRTKIDLGDDGRVETSIVGFLSGDLSVQTVETTEFKVGKDKRAQNFWARTTLEGGKLRAERRINGELSRSTLEAPPGSVLSELVEALQQRLLGPEKKLFVLPMIGAYDDEPGVVKIEIGGLHKMKEGETTSEVFVSYVARDEAGVMTYWHGPDRFLQRVASGNQSLVIRRLK